MCFVLQFAAFLSICCLIRDVVTHPNQDKDKRVNNKHVRHSGPGIGDFYFDELKGNDDYLKTGRVVPQSAWSKEDKEQTQPVENKAGAQFSDDFSFKSALSYFLNMLEELKKNVFSIKEMTSVTDSKGLANSRGDSEDMVKQNKMEENSNKPKTDAPAKNTEFENENQRPKSNYITEYYQDNDIKFVEDDLETSGGDESDDSSHKTDEGTDLDDDTCIYECSKISGEPVRPSYDIEETTAFLSSQTKVPEENGKVSQNTKSDEKGDDFKESTTKPSKMKPNSPKTSGKETENMTTAIPSSKTGICLKKNNDGSSKANEKNEPSKKHLKSIEYPTSSPQNKKDNKAKSEECNQNKTPDNLAIMNLRSSNSKSSGENSINKDGSNLDGNSGVSEQSTTLSPQSSKDVIHPESMENKPYTSGISSEKQQEQVISMKPENQKQAKKNPKPLEYNDRANEDTKVSLKSFRAESETPNLEKNTDTKTKERPNEGSNNDSSLTMVTYNEHEQNSKTEDQQISNSFDTENTISPATSGNNMNSESLNNHPTNNLNGKKETDENKKPNPKQGKKDSESQENKETAPTETQQSNNDSKLKKSSENNKLTDSTNENENPDNSNASKQGKKDSESQGNKETAPTEAQQLNNDSESDKSSKNNKLTDSTSGNEISEKSNPTKKGENNPETQINKEALPTETQQSNNNSEPDKSFINNKLTDSTKGDENSEKSNDTKKGKNYSETQRNTEAVPTEKQQLNNDSGMINSLKNKKLNHSNRENNEKVVDNTDSMFTNDSPSPYESNLKIQNQGVEGFNKQQESKPANEGNLNENDGMVETPPDEEYEYDDNENSDTFDKFMEMMTSGDFNQNQEAKLITNISKEEINDEMNPENTSTVFTNESQISQQAENVMEGKPEEQYDTLLEYFYKHSNNPMILHLKNQSNKISLQKEV